MRKEFYPPEWVTATNVYEVNLRQYTREGTISAFMNELPRLKDMGVDTLWFMPLTPISQKNRKGSLGSYYACSDYVSVNPEFGTLEDFKKLVEKAHAFGFKIILDWVANHTGWDHTWTISNPEFYKKEEDGSFKVASGMDDIIELDFHNPDLVKAMIAAMKFWITECAIDGFRCDLAFWVNLDFWRRTRRELDAVKHLFWLGEMDHLDNPDYMQVFDASYTWTWMHKTEDFYKEHLPLSVLETVLERYTEALPHHSAHAWFTSNHDENSWNGTEYEKYGNMVRALAVFSCTWNGIPLIYSGQELPNKKRLAFFERDPIEWTGQNTLHDFYKKLLQLHSANPALYSAGKEAEPRRIKTNSDNRILAFSRKKDQHEVIVVLNFSREDVSGLELHYEAGESVFRNLFDGTESALSRITRFEIRAWGYMVFEK